MIQGKSSLENTSLSSASKTKTHTNAIKEEALRREYPVGRTENRSRTWQPGSHCLQEPCGIEDRNPVTVCQEMKG